MAVSGNFNRFQNRQRSRVDLTPTVNARLEGGDDFTRRIVALFREVKRWDLRQEIAKAAAPVIIASARKRAQNAFVNNKIHYTYNTPKIIGKLKAPKGKGRKVGEYHPDNLKRSIVDIAERRQKYKKKTYKVIIGPYYRGRGPITGTAKRIFDNDSKIDGYYAHIVYGSAVAFRNRIMIPALQQVKGKALELMKRKAAQIIVREGLDVNLDIVRTI
jgi:hypothetical protein